MLCRESLFVSSLLVGLALVPAGRAQVRVVLVNKCTETVWPALFGRGNDSAELPEEGGFELKPEEERTLHLPAGWVTARVWARTGCTGAGDQLDCATGDCAGRLHCDGITGQMPATLAEFTLARTKKHTDFYHISYTEGANVPMILEPEPESVEPDSQGGQYYCRKAGECYQPVLKVAAEELQFKRKDEVLGLLSACMATKEDKFCCRGEFASSDKCRADNFPAKFYQDLRENCPNVRLYLYDEHSTFICRGNKRPSPDYRIQFCTDKGEGLGM